MKYREKMKEIENQHNSFLEQKCRQLEADIRNEVKANKQTENETVKRLKKSLKQYETDWIPLSKHEQIVNSELERLESKYQEQLSSIYSQAVSQVELRVKEEMANITREKHKVEMYSKELEALNEQLRGQLSKRPNRLLNSARLSPGSFIT